jgi:hypothetical protein
MPIFLSSGFDAGSSGKSSTKVNNYIHVQFGDFRAILNEILLLYGGRL